MRYQVSKQTIIEWCLAEFLPPPVWIKGAPYWWPGALEFHDLIVWSNGGQPHFDKQFFHGINSHSNKAGMYPFGQGKKRGRPRKAA